MNRRDFLYSAMAAATASWSRLISPEGLIAQVKEKARLLNLKITDMKTILVDAQNDENFVFVKIYTNQGIVGLGEGTLTGKEATVAEAIMEHKRYLVGKDPTDIEFHWQGMFRGPRYRGGPVLSSALSAVEIALWDILGQALGQPIWRLLGGKARNRVRIYPHANGRTVESSVREWMKMKDAGWTACKGTFVDYRKNMMEPTRAVRLGLEKLKAVREALGPDFDICVELHGQATTTMAVDFCTRAEEFRPFFVEEATQLEDLGELALLRSKTRVPLATGERLFTKYGFSEICARHLVDYVQPDVVHCGGILEMKKIGTIAEAFRIELAPHNPQSEVSTIASLHVCMCTPNATILEIGSGQKPFWNDLFYGGVVRFENGYALPPDKPGLGIDVDEKVAAKFPYKPKDWHGPTFPDGSIADR
jgi:galactonate dehydratase